MTGNIFDIQRFSINDGPGIRTTVFFSGCPLSCPWCHNPECFDEKSAQEISADALLALLLRDRAFWRRGGGVTLSGGEPTAQPGFAKELLALLGSAGVHRALDTCGDCEPALFAELSGACELVLFDLKTIGNPRIEGNFRALLGSGRDFIVRFPLIPDHTDSVRNLRALAALLLENGVSALEVSPYHDLGAEKYRRLGRRPPDIRKYSDAELSEKLDFLKTLGLHPSLA